MKRNLKNKCAKSLALVMAAALVATAVPVSADAAAKKPKLSKTKVSVKKGKTVKITVKGVKAKKIKKTTWSLTKSGKKIVSLSKKKKNSVTIKGKKKGSTKVTAKIKVGKKTYKKTVKVTVKASGSNKDDSKNPATTAPAAGTTTAPAAGATTAPAAGSTTAPAAGTTTAPAPSQSAKPSDVPGTQAPIPTEEPLPTYPALKDPVVKISPDNEGAGTADKEDGTASTYRGDVEWGEDGSVTFTNINGYNGGMMFNLQGGDVVDISKYKWLVAEVDTNDEVMLKTHSDSTNFWSQMNDGMFEGAGNTGRRQVKINIEDGLGDMRAEGVAAVNVTAKGVDENDENSPSEITIYSIELWETDEGNPTPTEQPTAEPTATAAPSQPTSGTDTQGGTDVDTSQGTQPSTAPEKPEASAEPTEPAVQKVDSDVELTNANAVKDGPLYDADWNAAEQAIENEDGSITINTTAKYSGGGLWFYLNKDKSAFDISKYSKIQITVSAKEAGRGLYLGLVCDGKKSPPWGGDPSNVKIDAKPSAYPTMSGDDKDDVFEVDLSDVTIPQDSDLGADCAIVGVDIKYNGYKQPAEGATEEEQEAFKTTYTVKSIKFIK